MNKQKKLTKMIVVNALLIALTVVLTYVSNYIQIQPGVSLNLSLIPIAIAAILFKEKSAIIVGLVNGAIVLLGANIFLAINPVATVFICLLKSSLAGLLSALLYRFLNKINKSGKGFIVKDVFIVSLCCVIIPLINTAIYVLGIYLFFPHEFFISVLPGSLNVIIEVLINLLISPAICYVIKLNTNKL